MSAILDFYRDDGKTADGYTLEDILAWPDRDYAFEKHYVGWLFPMPERYAVGSDAPILSEGDIAAFRGDPLLRERLRRAAERFLRFLGLSLDRERVEEATNFETRYRAVWFYQNENWMRVSRLLTSLMALGQEPLARAVFAWLDAAYRHGRLGCCDPDSRRAIEASHRIWAERVGE